MRRPARIAVGFVAALAGAWALAITAVAFAPLGSDLRISRVGVDGDADRDGFRSAVAYNSTDNEYLVVWEGDGLATDDEFEIFGQRVSATGAELGANFRISSVGFDGVAARDAEFPAVAYNPTANEYLVTWSGDGLPPDGEFEIFGHRVSGGGGELGADFRISSVGADGDAARDARFPAVAYSSTANEYLVTWDGDGLVATDDEFEVFGQRVKANGAEVGPNDFRISNVGTDGDTNRAGFISALAYNSTDNEYLVAWQGDGLVATDDEFEIFGQRLDTDGVELGSDFRISNVGTDGDIDRDGSRPAAAHNPTANEYLVTWEGDGLATAEELEIFGQRVSPAGARISGNFRISNVGTDGDPARDALNGRALAYNSTANEYLVVWFGDGLATDEEFEIFGQRVSASGAALGSDFRISDAGADGDPGRAALTPTLAYNSSDNEYLVAWQGNDLPAAGELEIFGRRVGILPPPSPTPTPPPPPPAQTAAVPPSNAFELGKLKRNKKKGIAFLIASFPGPGEVGLAGKGAKNIGRAAGAARKSAFTTGGRMKLRIKPAKKGKRAHKVRNRLKKKGKAKVKVLVTYVPTGGLANTQVRKVKLVRK